MLDLTELVLGSAVVALWTVLFALVRFMAGNENQRLAEENRELKKQIKDEVDRCRQHYETLLKELGIRNRMMNALWKAYSSGELGNCYAAGGKPRVLADGAVICEKGEESYLIESKEEEGEIYESAE